MNPTFGLAGFRIILPQMHSLLHHTDMLMLLRVSATSSSVFYSINMSSLHQEKSSLSLVSLEMHFLSSFWAHH